MMRYRHSAWPTLVAAAVVGLQAEVGSASTCKDELDRFQSRLYGSDIAADRPQLFQELVRKAERAAELRDEQQCLRRVAELNQALPENDSRQPTAGETSIDDTDAQPAESRPDAPVLLIADGDQSGQDDEDEQTEISAARGDNEELDD